MHKCFGCGGEKTLIVLDVRGQENGLWDLIPSRAKNATERESVRVLSVPGRVYHHTQTDGYQKPFACFAALLVATPRLSRRQRTASCKLLPYPRTRSRTVPHVEFDHLIVAPVCAFTFAHDFCDKKPQRNQ
jgi:hypothetical protein